MMWHKDENATKSNMSLSTIPWSWSKKATEVEKNEDEDKYHWHIFTSIGVNSFNWDDDLVLTQVKNTEDKINVCLVRN